MSRPLRIIEPGLWHHTMNRGRNSSPIFRNDPDRKRFLALMRDCGRRWELLPVAYCLMDNHYHVMWLDKHGNLDRGMRHLNGVYTQHFNGKYGHDGTLFRGRYRDRLVQQERYLAEVVRYLHMNPVEAGLVAAASEYPWSSHRAYLGTEELGWIRSDLASPYVPGGGEAPDEFDAFVHERIPDETRKLLNPRRWTPLLGDDDFFASMRPRVRRDGRKNHAEIPQGRGLGALDIDLVLNHARQEFGIDADELLAGRRGSRNEARLLTILACREFTTRTGRDIGEIFGVRASTVPSLVRNARAAVRKNGETRARWERFVELLGHDNTQSSIAVGTALTGRPPHRSQRAELPHWAPTSGGNA